MPRIERQRIVANYDLVDIDGSGGPSEGSGAALLHTFTETTYPTSAGSFYACKIVSIDGTEAEGDTPTFTDEDTVYAYNVGTTIPPTGSYVVGHAVGGKWVIRWDV